MTPPDPFAVAANAALDRRLRRAWRVLIALSLALVAAVAFVQHRYRADMAAFKLLQQQGSPAFRAAVARFTADEQADRLLLHIRDPKTGRWRTRIRDELAQSLFPGRTPTTVAGNGSSHVVWADPVRGLAFDFGYGSDGSLSSYSFSPLPATPPAQPWLLRTLRDLDPLRRMWVGSFTAFTIGPMLWGALFIATIFWRRARLPLAHAQLLVAWLCFLGWLLHPNYSIFWVMFSNDMLFWGVLMLIASCFSLQLARQGLAAAAADRMRCRACGYDLTGNVSGVCSECGAAVRSGDEKTKAAPA